MRSWRCGGHVWHLRAAEAGQNLGRPARAISLRSHATMEVDLIILPPAGTERRARSTGLQEEGTKRNAQTAPVTQSNGRDRAGQAGAIARAASLVKAPELTAATGILHPPNRQTGRHSQTARVLRTRHGRNRAQAGARLLAAAAGGCAVGAWRRGRLEGRGKRRGRATQRPPRHPWPWSRYLEENVCVRILAGCVRVLFISTFALPNGKTSGESQRMLLAGG